MSDTGRLILAVFVGALTPVGLVKRDRWTAGHGDRSPTMRATWVYRRGDERQTL